MVEIMQQPILWHHIVIFKNRMEVVAPLLETLIIASDTTFDPTRFILACARPFIKFAMKIGIFRNDTYP